MDRQAGVDWAQGSFFAEPMSFEQLTGSRFAEEYLSPLAEQYYREIKKTDLETPADPEGYFGQSGHPLLFARGILEKKGGRLVFLRMNEEMKAILEPHLTAGDQTVSGSGNSGEFRRLVLENLEKAERQQAPQNFSVVLDGEEYLAAAALLAENQEEEKKAYLFALFGGESSRVGRGTFGQANRKRKKS